MNSKHEAAIEAAAIALDLAKRQFYASGKHPDHFNVTEDDFNAYGYRTVVMEHEEYITEREDAEDELTLILADAAITAYQRARASEAREAVKQLIDSAVTVGAAMNSRDGLSAATSDNCYDAEAALLALFGVEAIRREVARMDAHYPTNDETGNPSEWLNGMHYAFNMVLGAIDELVKAAGR